MDQSRINFIKKLDINKSLYFKNKFLNYNTISCDFKLYDKKKINIIKKHKKTLNKIKNINSYKIFYDNNVNNTNIFFF